MLSPSDDALNQLDRDPGCKMDQTADLLNAAVAYIHSISRAEWTENDQEIDDLEVSSRPLEVNTGWWENLT